MSNCKQTFLDGALLVEYNQRESRHSGPDSLTMTFHDEGTYHFVFTETPGKSARSGRGADKLPKDFKTTVNRVPREQIFSQWILPDFLRIAVTRDGVTEHRDFR